MKHYIIPIFIPHYGCLHQCVFCNQKRITGIETPVTSGEVANIIKEHLSRVNQPRHIEVAFYGGSFTALPAEIQQSLLLPANCMLKQNKIHAIRISTRPDCIDCEKLDLLYNLGVSIIELGAQSLDDNVLVTSARGHTAADVSIAVKLIKEKGMRCGLQLMVGLPGENWPSLIKTTYKAALLKPDFTRIYPTLVVADTHLATLFQRGLYRPLALAEAASRSAFMKLVFSRQGISVIRTGLQATEDLANNNVVLAGPYHPSFGEIVDSYIFNAMVIRCLDRISVMASTIVIHHHPKDSSKLRGLGNSNIRHWQECYRNILFKLLPDGKGLGELIIEIGELRLTATKDMMEC